MPDFLNLNSFFAEWKDSTKVLQYTFLVVLALFFALLGISVIPGQTPATFYLWFVGAILFFMVLEFLSEKNKFVGLNFFGVNHKKTIIGIIIGVIVGWVMVTQKLSIIGAPTAFSAISTLNALYIIVVAVLAEEFLFRGFLFPTLTKHFSWWISLLATSGIFTAFHFYVYVTVLGAGIGSLVGVFAFSVIAIVGNAFFKSISFGIGAHFLNNWLSVFRVA